MKQERFLTVSLYPEQRPRSPWIRLRGLWLKQAGFAPQARVRVRIMQGCLVITTE
jgi:toxic protein SymE